MVLLGGLTLSREAFACSCAGLTAEEAVERMDAIFVGRVEHVESRLLRGIVAVAKFGASKLAATLTGREAAPPAREDESIRVRITIELAYKGNLGSEVTVLTGFGGGDCGYSFKEGVKYLVYASGKGPLYASICSRTRPLASAADDLKVLDRHVHTQPEHPHRSQPDA